MVQRTVRLYHPSFYPRYNTCECAMGFCVTEPDYNALVAETEDVLDVDSTPCDEEGLGADLEDVNALGSHGRVHHE